jgi:Planctomycete extracellular
MRETEVSMTISSGKSAFYLFSNKRKILREWLRNVFRRKLHLESLEDRRVMTAIPFESMKENASTVCWSVGHD